MPWPPSRGPGHRAVPDAQGENRRGRPGRRL